ncbi:FUN14 domain-containing protein [Nitrososphaera sp. AFS]|uniref:FUN14 domain-containing protein n=1 Tax=Nitrososphaera sp. AFS TaxID=2301191 RepID=UPI0013922E53|nr:FUN14 domain-containing protein [Nitrososphaera sp. AFS]
MEIGIAAASLGGGFVGGIVIGYALKKVAKVVAVVLGLFSAGLTYLQYQGIVSMNWNKLQDITQGAANTIVNASQHGIPGVVTPHGFDSWGLPITGGMAMGVTIGFMKG